MQKCGDCTPASQRPKCRPTQVRHNGSLQDCSTIWSTRSYIPEGEWFGNCLRYCQCYHTFHVEERDATVISVCWYMECMVTFGLTWTLRSKNQGKACFSIIPQNQKALPRISWPGRSITIYIVEFCIFSILHFVGFEPRESLLTWSCALATRGLSVAFSVFWDLGWGFFISMFF